jgi:hypothetical protein
MPRHQLATENQLPPIYISGRYFDPGQGSTTRGTIAGVANRMAVYPFVPNLDIEVDQIIIDVTTGVASALARALIYESDGTNFDPGTRLLQTANYDCSTSGVKVATQSFSFEAGHWYWVGVHNSSTATLRGIPIADLAQLGVIGSSSGAVYNGYRRDVAFGASSPDPFGSATQANQVMPQVRFRIA